MANELYFKIIGRYTPANTEAFPAPAIGTVEKYIDQVGDDHQAQTQVVGITEEELFALPDIVAVGYMFIKNIDDTNFVQIGFTTGVYGMRLYPGEFALFRLEPGIDIFALADTAAVRVQYIIYEH